MTHDSKRKLSKNVLQMKFMRRSVMRTEKEQNDESLQKIIDDEHWVIDIPESQRQESRFQIENSYVKCEDLVFGRLSFNGFNPVVEKMMRSNKVERELEAAEKREKEVEVNEEEMAERYESLVGFVAKKFSKKRKQQHDSEEDLTEKGKKKKMQCPKRMENKGKHKIRKAQTFLKPTDD